MPNKLGDPAGCHYLVTTLTFYYSTVTDLTLSRSVHATELEPCCPDPFLLSSSDCRAIHYGQCSSLLKLPTFAIVPSNCNVERNVERTTVPRQEENVLRLSLGTSKISPSVCSESLEKETCSSLDLLAANIEQNIKPFLNIFSSSETSDLTNADQDDSIGNLATSLQFHLGNFIAAVKQQQQISGEESKIEVGAKCSVPSEPLYSTNILKKKSDFQGKTTAPVSRKDRIYANEGPSAHDDEIVVNDWPSRSVHKSTTTQDRNHTSVRDDLTGEKKNLRFDSHDRTKDQYVKKVSNKWSSETKPNYLQNAETALAKQREVMRILNKTDSVKNTLLSKTDSVDSELLDSLISLMNVSLIDLEDSPQKKNHYQKGKTYVSNAKPLHRSEPRIIHTASEDHSLEDPDVSVRKDAKKRGVDNVQHPPCRKKLIFDGEGSSESFGVPRSHESTTIISGKQSFENGELGVIPNEVLNCGDWSISSFHRRDSLAPILPPVFDAKRPYTGSRCTSATDHNHPVSTAKSSVAERVLAFEKCPDWNIERSSGLKEFTRKASKDKDFLPVLPKKAKYSSRHVFPENSGAQLVKKPSQIPKFHFPNGQPHSSENVGAQTELLKSAFASYKGKVTYETFHIITKACSLPLYWKMPLYLAVGTDKLNNVTTNRFLDFWKRMTNVYFDEPSRFVYILSRGKRSFLLPEDFRPMIQDILDTHPGLTFLRDSKEFHSRYVDTVISRIFYDVNMSWSGRITALELRKSNFLQAVAELEEDDDINQMTEYFSYEHFYVIYCKFWKIDTDHDLLIDRSDIRHHNDGDISSRMLDRIFSGAVSREIYKTGHMRYTDFVWFLLAEEDKRHPRSIEYWFRCMDLNGDGFLSMYELEYFYDEQVRRMEALGIEAIPFKDCLCQMLDMVRPKTPEKISLSDLKHCKLTTLFFDTFFNLGKYLEHEQRDPFASAKMAADNQAAEISDWCRYAEEEYNRLISEENYGYSDRYQGTGQYYGAENAAFTKPEFVSKVFNKPPERDDDDDYADSDADY